MAQEAVCRNLAPEAPKMKDLARRAAREEVEYGAAITGDWRLGKPIRGKPHEVSIPRPPGARGSYHTHKLDAKPSMPDLWEMLSRQEEAMCIAEAKVSLPQVKCYFPTVPEDFRALGLAVQMTNERQANYITALHERYGKAEARTEGERIEGLGLLRSLRHTKAIIERRWQELIGACGIAEEGGA